MNELETKISELGAVDALTLTQELNKLIRQHESAKGLAWRVRMPGTEYKAGDKVIVPGVSNFDKILRCETAGTTAETDFPEDYNTLEIGSVITDGTVEWGVVNLITMPNSAESPVTSVNGKTGDVNLTAKNVGADPAGTAANAVSTHNADNNAHKTLFDNHRAELASDSESGHVKVDGQTIVSEDGVIKAVGGLAIGSIFPFPASVPPEGAYLLNGQTIYGCNELYPKFWEWLVNNAGETTATPVYKTWNMPSLSADGTVGGADYAVEASRAASSGYEAYKSFDQFFGGATSFAAFSSSEPGHLTYYAPVPLKITQAVFTNPSNGTTSNRPTTFVISGSNDNKTWTELASGGYTSTANSATQLVDISDSKYDVDNPGYQYFKFYFVNSGGSHLDCPEITLHGQEYLRTAYTGNGKILTLSAEAYEDVFSRTGVCGAFVIDSVTGSVRLPTLINGTLWGADSSNIGQSLAAGLPNIEGALLQVRAYEDVQGAFYQTEGRGYNHSGARDKDGVGFDASLSNPIYGNSDTVQPPAIRVSWCIQVFNAATALSEQESAQLASQMQMKAQTDLANVTANLDFVVEAWTADDNSSWYRKYRFGWVEQGGIIPNAKRGAGANGQNALTFPVEFADTNYAFTGTPSLENTNAVNCNLIIFSKGVASAVVNCYDDNAGTVDVYWFACGQAATE